MDRASAAKLRHPVWQSLLLLSGLALFALLIYGAGPGEILAALGRLGWLAPLVALPYFASYAVDSIGWWWILSRRMGAPPDRSWRTPGLLRLFAMRAGGEAVNAITPTAYFGGEPLKAWLLCGHGVPLAFGLASVFVTKTALMITQGLFVLLGLLIALQWWHSTVPLPVAFAAGLALGALACVGVLRVQQRGLCTLILGLSRRLTGRQQLLAEWEGELAGADRMLRGFYGSRAIDFLVCCTFHFLGWVMGTLEVYIILWMLGQPIPFAEALAIEALSGVAKLAALIIPGSLGVQEGGQVLIFVAFGLEASLAMTFGVIRRCRELVWVGFGLGVLVRHQALRWLRGRGEG